MKKSPKPATPMREEYDFRGGTRGKYADRASEGSNVVKLDPDVAAVFHDAESVNRALRAIIEAFPGHRS